MNNRIKELRINLGFTQDSFGQMIGSARNTIANYENGNRTPSNAVIKAICREFSVNEHWLRTGDGEMFIELDREAEITAWAAKLVSSGQDKEFIRRFVHLLVKLDERDWECIEKMANILAEEAQQKKEVD